MSILRVTGGVLEGVAGVAMATPVGTQNIKKVRKRKKRKREKKKNRKKKKERAMFFSLF